MKHLRFAIAAPLVIAGLAACAGSHAFAQTAAASKLDPQQVEQIIRQYILDHPEVVLESVRQYDQREKAAQQQRSRDVVLAHRSELDKDAASPAAEPGKSDKEPVTIVEFFDYRCGYCRKVEDVVSHLAGAPGVRVVYKEFPILGPESAIAARAALAADRQGSYQKFHHALLTSASQVTPETIAKLAADSGLDVARLKKDMASPEIEAALERNRQLAETLGVQSTPTFVVGQNVVSGALDPEKFQALIEDARRGLKAAPTAGGAGF